MSVSVGEPVPELSFVTTGEQQRSLSDYRGRKLVLYFYPKASTPGCTTESQDFRDLAPQFEAAGTAILGVSRDSLKAQERFKAKHEFPFELVADTDEALCQGFGVIKNKSLYGRTFLGIERSTFLVDADGRLAREWRKVKVAGHAEEVLAAAQDL